MSTKPPKGIEQKKCVQSEESEALWHLLNGVSSLNLEASPSWDTLAFGLLGGVDISQQSNLLRDRPVRIQVQTHRASFAHFCQTLQLGFEEYVLNNQWTPDSVDSLLELTDNVFYINRKGVWKLSFSEDGETWWAQNRTGKVWNREGFRPKRGERLWLVENVSDRSMEDIIHLALAEQCAHFINATGIDIQVQNWMHHIRRPSLRKSWHSILSDSQDYYWASVQLYHEIHAEADVAFRERYIQFLLQCAEYLHCPNLKTMALDFRKSKRYWHQLSTVLLEESSEMLKCIPTLDWMNMDTVFEHASTFVTEEFTANLDARLSLMEDSVERIVSSERHFFVMVSELLSGLTRGRLAVQQLVVQD